MSYSPPNHCYLSAVGFMSEIEWQARKSDHSLHLLSEQVARKAINQALSQGLTMIKHEGGGVEVRVDLHVFSSDELGKPIAAARAAGERDAMRWVRP